MRVRGVLVGLMAGAAVLTGGCTVASGSGSTGSGATPNGHVPSVTGKRLNDAVSALSDAGYRKIKPEDATAANRIVVNQENWVVQSQTPAAGAAADGGTQVTLKVSKPTDSGGGATVAAGTVPDVVCKDLQAAQDALQVAGFTHTSSKDGSGQNRIQIADRNWVVIGQSAAVGSHPAPNTEIVLTVVKFGESTGSSGCKS
jgi:beta-lactam-binding protein with PASTA domain